MVLLATDSSINATWLFLYGIRLQAYTNRLFGRISGEAELPQRRRARRNQTPVVRARNATAPLSVQKFLSFGSYWFHLLGYPGIRSPKVAPEPPGDSDRTAWRVFSDPSWVRLKDLVFHQLDIFRGGRGIPFAGISFRADLAGA